MPTYRLKPQDIEAMRFDGSLECAHAICDWANKITSYATSNNKCEALVLTVEMRAENAQGKADRLVLKSLDGITLLINAPSYSETTLVEVGQFVVRHYHPSDGVHVRYADEMFGYEEVQTN